MNNPPKLDEIDRRILRELRRDGRISNAKLAERVGLSATPCWNRVKALEDAGVISGYAALLNQKALGLPDTVLIEVTLDRHDDEMFNRFGEALAQLPEVLEAHLLTGEYDYLIKVAVAGTEGYEEFLRHKLYKLPGLRHSHSTFVLRTLKREPGRPLKGTRDAVAKARHVVFDLGAVLGCCFHSATDLHASVLLAIRWYPLPGRPGGIGVLAGIHFGIGGR